MMKKLTETGNKNPFRIPEGYFEDANRRIIASTSGPDREEKKVYSFFRLRPYLLAAASIAGFIILSYTAIKIISPGNGRSIQAEALPADSLSPYVYELDINSLEEKAAALPVPDHGPDVSKAEIIDYLVLENIEINDIYEQL